jgi:hypothetical protein
MRDLLHCSLCYLCSLLFKNHSLFALFAIFCETRLPALIRGPSLWLKPLSR